ncbi:hypothetical protein ILUMI_14191 [Ignelater luminosus]|uniref:Paired domain-containing protein n=1 Tax=Ignelater luminosus TaxID=2038154 RepID=A0A8K0CX20_IGNLU|nr:hypothetical protein ILUMI_14191 [Ignelater luminosus]
MPSVKYYSSDLKNKIIQLYNEGKRQSDIANQLSIYRGTISKLIKKYKEHNTVECALKSGRPQKTDRKIKHLSVQDPRKTAKQIKNEIVDLANVSCRTVRRTVV